MLSPQDLHFSGFRAPNSQTETHQTNQQKKSTKKSEIISRGLWRMVSDFCLLVVVCLVFGVVVCVLCVFVVVLFFGFLIND